MSLSRRKLLTGGAAALGAAGLAGYPGRTARADSVGGKNLIVILVYGGWDVTYALDPKPGLSDVDVPAGKITSFGGIPIWTDPSRPSVSSFFEQYAPISAVINGISVQSINHPDCTKRILTGTASETNPDLGAIAAFELGRDLPAPYLVLGPTAYTGPLASIAARTGTVSQVRGLLDPDYGWPLAVEHDRYFPDGAESGLIRDYLHARIARERSVVGQHGYNAKRFDDFKKSLERGDLLKGFSEGFGDDFSFTLDLRVQIELGLRAIQEGISHSLHLEQAFAQWDTHAMNEAQEFLWDDLFDAMTKLASELTKRPGKAAGASMMDETVVCVLSEMSRTPKLNAELGKDHWPVTSALVFGGGVAGDAVYGASGEGLEALHVDLETGAPDPNGELLSHHNLVSGLLELTGVDPTSYLPNSEPFRAILA
jgi:hypothetical protein